MKSNLSAYVLICGARATIVAASSLVTSIAPVSISVDAPTSITITLAATSATEHRYAFADTCTAAMAGMTRITAPATSSLTRNIDVTISAAATPGLKLCYSITAAADDVAEQTALVLKVVAATSSSVIASFLPLAITAGAGTPVILQGSGIEDTDKYSVAVNCADPSLSMTQLPAGGASNAAVTRTITVNPAAMVAGASPVVYFLCYRKAEGSDSVQQQGLTLTAHAPTEAGVITDLSRIALTGGVPTQVTITGSGIEDGDKYSFAVDCASDPGTMEALPTGTATERIITDVTLAAVTAATQHELCYRKAVGIDNVKQTGRILTAHPPTLADAVTDLDVKTIVAGVAQVIKFTTAAAYDGKDKCYLTQQSTCSTTDLEAVETVPGGAKQFQITPALTSGTYKLCFQKSPGSDSVLQTTTATFLTVTAATQATFVKSISPKSISAGTATVITFTGDSISATDKFKFAVDCSSIHADMTELTSDKTGSVTLALGTWKLCYRQKTKSDNEEQTEAGVLEVVAATTATQVTAIAPATIEGKAYSALELTLTGANLDLGDKFMFAKADCTIADLTALSAEGEDGCVKSAQDIKCNVNLPEYAVGTYKLCFQNKGGSDIMIQTDVNMEVTAVEPAEDDGSNTTSAPSASVDECFPMRPTIACVLAVWLAF